MLMSFLLPNAALSAEAVNEPCSPSRILATTYTCVSPEGRRAHKTSKPSGALGERPVVFLLLAEGFCPSGVGQAHLHIQRVRKDTSTQGEGGFWPFLPGTGAPASLSPASAGPQPLLPGGGLGQSPWSLQQWPMTGTTCAG